MFPTPYLCDGATDSRTAGLVLFAFPSSFQRAHTPRKRPAGTHPARPFPSHPGSGLGHGVTPLCRAQIGTPRCDFRTTGTSHQSISNAPTIPPNGHPVPARQALLPALYLELPTWASPGQFSGSCGRFSGRLGALDAPFRDVSNDASCAQIGLDFDSGCDVLRPFSRNSSLLVALASGRCISTRTRRFREQISVLDSR